MLVKCVELNSEKMNFTTYNKPKSCTPSKTMKEKSTSSSPNLLES